MLTDKELLQRAVDGAGHGFHCRAPRWAHVGKVFSLGSTSATSLCVRFGLDPDAMIGGCADCGGDEWIDENGSTICNCDFADEDPPR